MRARDTIRLCTRSGFLSGMWAHGTPVLTVSLTADFCIAFGFLTGVMNSAVSKAPGSLRWELDLSVVSVALKRAPFSGS